MKNELQQGADLLEGFLANPEIIIWLVIIVLFFAMMAIGETNFKKQIRNEKE